MMQTHSKMSSWRPLTLAPSCTSCVQHFESEARLFDLERALWTFSTVG
jgi:hypothetical protein